MKELEGGDKVRVLLAQALFGNPDILLLDEPTNHLDLKSINWLEEFLFRFQNTVIIVSHDRHFLNQVCTHVADIDFGKIRSMSATTTSGTRPASWRFKQKQEENRKATDKANELKEFIHASAPTPPRPSRPPPARSCWTRLTIEDMPVSSRKYPLSSSSPSGPAAMSSSRSTV